MTSQFARQIADAKPSFDFVAAHFDCEQNRFSPKNPDGFVNLGSAQNFLHADRLASRMRDITPHHDDAHYQPFAGTQSCRTAIATHLGQIAHTEIDSSDVIVGNGIISVLEALAVAMLDPHQSILIPTPVFPGLVNSLSLRMRSSVKFLHTSADNDFRLTADLLDSDLKRRTLDGQPVAAVLISSPGNPVGQVFTADELAAFAAITKSYDCDLIVDEIYASSCFEDVAFASALSLQQDHVYVLGGLSKDFGLAGFATGWLHGRDRDVMRAVAKQSHFYRLPAPTQRVIDSVLEPVWRADYLREHRRKLTAAKTTACSQLHAAGIAVTPCDAGLCLWLDLRGHLRSPNLAGEMELYQTLLNDFKVHVSPGGGFKTPLSGFFRICFSQEMPVLREGIGRLVDGLASYAAKSHTEVVTAG